MRTFLFLALFGAIASAQIREVHFQGNLTPLNIMPTFDRGYTAVYDRDPGADAYLVSVDLYSSEGSLVYRASAHAPDGSRVSISNVAVDSDGSLAAAVDYKMPCQAPENGVAPRRAGGIALIDRTGNQSGFIDTGCNYWTTQVAFGLDHSIWTLGYLGNAKRDLAADYLTLRHYSPAGQELGAFLSRDSFPHPSDAHMEPLILPETGLWSLRVVNEQVEVMLPRADLWIEVSPDGREKGRWPTGQGARPFAFTADGRAWRQAGEKLMVFDRSSGAWTKSGLQGINGHLIGGDGNSLIFLMADAQTVGWVTAPMRAALTAKN
ncbi:MAG TPA: hypothetical protein VGL82_10490 [Bryobacteraceae bacterium]|jgi:hypothetical protein